ncbi:MAG: lipopolysaccharide kinase InaA family protein [Syntrophorhabdaceae bacterium]|nr:lipopolysaccharide kinase InaA family protein [Syntrophorhabdaceae bacterium]
MHELKEIDYGRYKVICFKGDDIDVRSLLEGKKDGRLIEGRGRAGIRVIELPGKRIVSRQYVHGGILRGITRDLFFSGKRAINELKIIAYLKERGFPVVEPYCVVIENLFLRKRLFMFTFYEENTVSFPEYLRSVRGKVRLRIIKRLAHLMYTLTILNVYHPDLHLDNILIKEKGEMRFLDFDRAYTKILKGKDVEEMFWRLNRYAEKLEKKGILSIELSEKAFFLKIFERLSGDEYRKKMERKSRVKGILTKIGWYFEKKIYG